MQEDFLHFLWQFQYFDRQNLYTTTAEPVHIFRAGILNTDAGPDFSQARIQIAGIEWIGQVEIHLCSSDWEAHNHQTDAAYENVILHVVWEYDKPVYRKDGTLIPALTLKDRTNLTLLQRYNQLLANKEVIPCASLFPAVMDIYKAQALDKALMQRLQQKAVLVGKLVADSQQNWEETAYQLLAQNLGFKLNAEQFLQLAKATPLKLIQKHRDNLLQIEALLFGQAGFLDTASEEVYIKELQREYSFLSHKYGLASQKMELHEWKFLRLRPSNFPTLRIAHLAALLQKHKSLFSLFLYVDSAKLFVQQFSAPASAYWHNHYSFEKQTEKTSQMGKESKENIIINTVIPLLVCYAEKKDDRRYLDKAIHLLETLPAEDNTITRLWKELHLPIKHAYDSQAGIELYNHFCTPKKCLSCPVGVYLLKENRNSSR